MKTSITTSAALIAAFAAGSPTFAQTPSIPDASEGTQCWDTLNNVSRDKNQGEGKLKPTGDNNLNQSGSNQSAKKQGPGAEPRDATGVTTGGSIAAEKRSGSTIRPAGLPNC